MENMMSSSSNQETIVKLMPIAEALAKKYSKMYRGYHRVGYDELLAEAYLSLAEAVSKFKVGYATKVETWAYTSVSQALRRYRDRNASLVTYPDNARGRQALRDMPEVLTEIKGWHLTDETESV